MSVNEPHAEVAPDNRPPQFAAPDWWIYRGTGRPMHDIDLTEILPPPPPWRNFRGGPLPEPDAPPQDDDEATRRLGSEYHLSDRDVDPHELDMAHLASPVASFGSWMCERTRSSRC